MVKKADYTKAASRKAYQAIYDIEEPLVTICIPTYNRADTLHSRSLKSAVDQTYGNLEIIVVGDCCTDHTETVVQSFNDPRIRFENLPVRGDYPDEPLNAGRLPAAFPLIRRCNWQPAIISPILMMTMNLRRIG